MSAIPYMERLMLRLEFYKMKMNCLPHFCKIIAILSVWVCRVLLW